MKEGERMEKICPDKKALRRYLFLHACLLGIVLIFPLYFRISKLPPFSYFGCLLLNLFSLYCPLCGGSRAVLHLFKLDFLAALQANAFALLLIAVIVFFDARAFVRLLRGEEQIYQIPQWIYTVMFIIMMVFWVLRNVLAIGFGIDPLGDLSSAWNFHQ